MAIFPTLSKQHDAGTFKEKSENAAIRPMTAEGAYDITRPRFTRRPRRTFSFAYKNISEADKDALQDFWDDHFGGSLAFTWTHPMKGTEYTVRFDSEMELEFDREAIGNINRFNTTTITLKEV